MKKRKLNSKNPKYMKKVDEPKIERRVSVQDAENFKVHFVFLDKLKRDEKYKCNRKI